VKSGEKRRTAKGQAKQVWRRSSISICAMCLLILAVPAAAQVEFEGTTMRASAFLNLGYDGDLPGAGEGGSDHGLTVGGTGDFSGFYYNPNFVSFSVQPYYNRSQANSASGSLFNSSGYTGNVNFFSGSHFPGNISFAQSYDSTGMFGVPQTTGLDTKGNSKSFGIGWSAILPDLPSLSVGYSRGSGSSSVLGSDEVGSSDTNTFTVHSGYRLAGMSMGGGFVHSTLNSDSSGFMTGSEGLTANTSSNTYTFNASRGFPTGGFGLGFSRSVYSDNYTGNATGGSNGATDSLFASVGSKLWKIPLSGSISYTDNLEGSFEQQQLSAGGPVVQSSLSPESRQLTMSLSSSDQILPHIFVTGFVSRQEIYIAGASGGITQLGANVSGNFGERFKGLTLTLGFIDSATKEGNVGGSAVAIANYRRTVHDWELEGSFVYNQSASTLLAIYQTSSLSYGGSVRHKFFRRVSWSLGAGGGRSGFVQTAGDQTRSASINSSLAGYRCSISGSYEKSDGTSVLTANGLVPVGLPVVTNNLFQFEGIGKGLSMSLPLLRGMSLSGAYTEANSTTTGLNTISGVSNNKMSSFNAYYTYAFRKMYLNAGVLQFRQGLSGSGTPPSVITSYYFGISRWFKAF